MKFRMEIEFEIDEKLFCADEEEREWFFGIGLSDLTLHSGAIGDFISEKITVKKVEEVGYEDTKD